MKDLKKHYENLIIGFGKGGKTLAAFLSSHGQEVALVEKSPFMYGGTCINVACIPTKSLIVSAENAIPYRDALDKKDNLTSFLRQKNFDNLNDAPSVTIITGTARFLSDHEIAISFSAGDEEARITAEKIFINTGTEPFIPNIAGIKNTRNIFTSATLMDQTGLPKQLIIIGGGFIGLEFANMYAKFGSNVVLLNRETTFLPKEDRDIADEIYKAMLAESITIVNSADVRGAHNANDEVILQYQDSHKAMVEIKGSAVLIATGRKPHLEDLNIQAAGVKTNARGFIEVDDQLRTNVNHIWAIGDINGGPQFTYISLDDFRIIRDQLFGGDYISTKKRKLVASSVFLSPPLAHIGLREKEALAKSYRIKTARLAAASIPRARILGNTQGLLKSVIDADTNRILGCTLFCVESSEMINTIQVAMNAELDYRVIRDTIFTHPSMNEAFNDLYASIESGT